MDIIDFFKEYEGFFAGMSSIIFGYIFALIPFDATFTVHIPILLLIVIVGLIWYIFVLKHRHRITLSNIRDKTLSGYKPQITIVSFDNKLLCLKSNFNNLISINSFLSIFYKENGFEKFYGIAKVINIQTNEILQCELIKVININQQPHKYDLIAKLGVSEQHMTTIMTLRNDANMPINNQ